MTQQDNGLYGYEHNMSGGELKTMLYNDYVFYSLQTQYITIYHIGDLVKADMDVDKFYYDSIPKKIVEELIDTTIGTDKKFKVLLTAKHRAVLC